MVSGSRLMNGLTPQFTGQEMSLHIVHDALLAKESTEEAILIDDYYCKFVSP